MVVLVVHIQALLLDPLLEVVVLVAIMVAMVPMDRMPLDLAVVAVADKQMALEVVQVEVV